MSGYEISDEFVESLKSETPRNMGATLYASMAGTDPECISHAVGVIYQSGFIHREYGREAMTGFIDAAREFEDNRTAELVSRRLTELGLF